jgi:hypothetical protein
MAQHPAICCWRLRIAARISTRTDCPRGLPEGEPVATPELPLHEFQLTEESFPLFASEMANEALMISTLARK